MPIIYISIAFVLAAILMFFFFKRKETSAEMDFLNRQKALEDSFQKELSSLKIQVAQSEEKNKYLEAERNKLESGNLMLEKEKNDALLSLSALRAEVEKDRNFHEQRKEEYEQLQQKWTLAFDNIANNILKKNTTEFSESNIKGINEILNPLKEQLKEFERKMGDVHEKELRDNVSLRDELKRLHELNYKISADAENLTKALKGDVKKQGNWGEIILERILEKSGLNRDEEYKTQETFRSDSGEMLRPDVVVYLPENKQVVVDSKVSLLAYEQYVSCENEEERGVYLKRHIESVRNHVKILSDKDYTTLSGLHSPEFVLLFMPIESAFSLAVQNDSELFVQAWDKRIIIVSPTTLMATLRTIAGIWRNEKQTLNALEIARQGGALYDKFVAFVEDMRKLQNQIHTLQKTYDSAEKKLISGTGNLVGRAEKMRKLGIKNSKELSAKNLLEHIQEDSETTDLTDED